MVGQDAVAFYLLGEQVSKQVKVVLSGQGADEVFGGYFWYPRMVQAVGSDLKRFSRHYFDRDHPEFLKTVTAPYRGNDHTSALIGQLLALPGADDYLDQVLRLDVTTLIVDDFKYVLKEISRGLIPDAVVDRKKGYFPVPALKYVRGPFLEMMRDTLNSNACRQRGLFSRSYVQGVLDAPDEHFTRLQGSKLWHLALLEMWLQIHV